MRAAALACAVLLSVLRVPIWAGDGTPLRLVVMDPLCRELACDCVKGYARRDYRRLASFLANEMGRDVRVACAESLVSPEAGEPRAVDLIVGKFSAVAWDAARARVEVRPLAMLTSRKGETTLEGLFIVRKDDPAKSVADLAGRRILFGPPDSDEKRAAALAALEAFGIPMPAQLPAAEGCTTAAMAVVDGASDAAVISSYAMPLLEGCGTIAEGELRVIGRTDPVPFIGVFATGRVPASLDAALRAALCRVAADAPLLEAMESGDGFIPIESAAGADSPCWNDWRGPARDGISRDVPDTLPARPRLLWSRTMTGPGMSGLAVSAGRVLVADKGDKDTTDIFRCLDADTGREIWKLAYRAEGSMDFTNSPRATPVVRDGLVYTLGAFGHVHCLRLDTGEVVWRRNIAADFGAEVPAWGASATPLIVDDNLIVNPGAKDASLAALDRRTGAIVWKSPGDKPAYASFVLAAFDSVRQIVGYDGVSLGGWDPTTGRRLWRLEPENEGDFNVPTPVVVGNRLLVATENNGTRLFGFDGHGSIVPKPIAKNDTLSPDTATPVIVAGRVLGSCGSLVCLDLDAGLRTVWEEADAGGLGDYCSFIAGHRHVLVAGVRGGLLLLDALSERFQPVARLELFSDVPDTERDVWSHPALVGRRLYVRNLLAVSCFSLATDDASEQLAR